MPWELLPLAQAIPEPDPDQPWVWVALVMATAVGAVFWRLDAAQNRRIEACNEREARKDKAIDDLRAELAAMAREATAASAKQLEAAQEQAKAHAEERRVLLGLLGKSPESAS